MTNEGMHNLVELLVLDVEFDYKFI